MDAAIAIYPGNTKFKQLYRAYLVMKKDDGKIINAGTTLCTFVKDNIYYDEINKVNITRINGNVEDMKQGIKYIGSFNYLSHFFMTLGYKTTKEDNYHDDSDAYKGSSFTKRNK